MEIFQLRVEGVNAVDEPMLVMSNSQPSRLFLERQEAIYIVAIIASMGGEIDLDLLQPIPVEASQPDRWAYRVVRDDGWFKNIIFIITKTDVEDAVE